MKYLLSFFFSLILAAVYAQPFKPLLHLITGETYYMSSSGTTELTQNIHGRENKVKVGLSFTMAFKVMGKTDSVYNMGVHYQAIEMNIHMQDTTINMNSAQKEKTDTASLLMAAIVNKPFNIAITVRGKVIAVKNLDKIFLDAFDNFRLMDATKKEQIKSRFVQSFGENAFKGSLENGVAIFPNSGLAKNAKWTVNSNLSSPAKARVKTVYQLTDISPDVFIIHGDGIITTDEDIKPEQDSGTPLKYELNGGMVTDIKIDKKTGWISALNIKQFTQGSLEIMDNPKTPGGMTIPMMIKTEINVTGK
ncbi:DUF6263 family protein [Mucilaginibacter gotjawali]|nr:DUF6263 family protein [Mucilaginibacter gotjawali]MBB3056933.1 hypothetical protein [Mucilaginibacter gotjawali]